MPPFLKKLIIILTCVTSFILILSNFSDFNLVTRAETPPAATPAATPAKPDIGKVGGARQNSTTKSSSFSECDFSSVANKADASTKFIACIKGVVTFIFVVSLFLVAIRIAVEALGSLNPFESGKAVDNSIKLVSDIIIGLLILGAPSIFLNFLNPQTLRIDIIQNISEGSKSNKDPKAPITPGGTSAVSADGAVTVADAGGDIAKKDILDAAMTDPIKSKAVADQIKLLANNANTVDGYNGLAKYLDTVTANGGRPALDAILQANNYQASAMYTPNQVIKTLTGDATFVPSTDPNGLKDFKELQLTFTTNPLRDIVTLPLGVALISNGNGCTTNPPTGIIKAGTPIGNANCEYKVRGS